jgi:hypothetical protein
LQRVRTARHNRKEKYGQYRKPRHSSSGLNFRRRQGRRAHGKDRLRAGYRTRSFVYLFGRADFTVSYFGANVYPENISVGLEQPDIRNLVPNSEFLL